jgi:hypothetical protein
MTVPPAARADAPRGRPARRARLAAAALALAVATLAGRGEAGERSTWRPEHERALNVERRAAIRRGCAWIAEQVNQDGSFGDNKAIVAFTSLSALALMAEGSTLGHGPAGGRGPHGKHVARAVEWLVKLVEQPERQRGQSTPEGYFYWPQDASSKMHGQGYATLALASALGSADEGTARRIRTALQKAVRCAETSQTGTGGWGYYADPAQEHEGSVTVTIAQGLRAANYAGVKVSRDTVVRGLDYLRRSQKRYVPGAAQAEWDGSFKYSISTERSTYALTAAAISSFFLFGEYGSRPEDKDGIARGVAFLKRTLRRQMRDREWHFYGHFYAAWAAWQRDGDRAEAAPGEAWGSDPASDDLLRTDAFWGPWHAKVYPDLLRTQRADGSWEDPHDDYKFGDLLPTAFAVLTLAVPDELIPVFQR